MFDDGYEECFEDIDFSSITTLRRPSQTLRRVDVDIPEWMIGYLDQEAAKLGVTRQTMIRVWLQERLEQGANF